VFIGEATNTNFIVFGMIRTGVEPTIYHTQGELAKHYAIDAVVISFLQISRIPLIGLVTILGWGYRKKISLEA